MEKFKIILVKATSFNLEVKELEAPNRYELLKPVGELIGGWCELVHPQRLPYPYCFICDEEGLLKENPKMNPIATLLYNKESEITYVSARISSLGKLTGVKFPIVGDIVIMREIEKRGGIDLLGLTNEEIEEVRKIIKELIKK